VLQVPSVQVQREQVRPWVLYLPLLSLRQLRLLRLLRRQLLRR
jgi:hypothetical protein